MARKRMIDPAIWTDEQLGELSLMARLLFIGLISSCDDEGITKAHPAYLKATIFPYDNIELEEIINARDSIVSQLDSVQLYETDSGKQYIKLLNWNEYQYINKPTPSKLPKPEFKKKAIPLVTRRAVAKRYDVTKAGDRAEAKCHYCGMIGKVSQMDNSWVHFEGLELDHIIPESNGGDNGPDNIILSCRSCNRKKGNTVIDNNTTVQPSINIDGLQPNGIEKKGIEKNSTSISSKKPMTQYQTVVKRYYELYQDRNSGIKPTIDGKVGKLIKSDLRKFKGTEWESVGDKVLCDALELYDKEEDQKCTEFIAKAGFSYSTFHGMLNYILDHYSFEEFLDGGNKDKQEG